MTIGQMKHRLHFEERTESDDGHGGRTVTWKTKFKVWGVVQMLNGSEIFRAQQLESPVSHTVRIRHRDDVTTKMRVRFGTRLFNIRSAPTPLTVGGRWMAVMVQEGVKT